MPCVFLACVCECSPAGGLEMQKIQTCIMLIRFHLSCSFARSLAHFTEQKASSVTGDEAAGLFNKIWQCGLGRVKKGSGRLNGDNYPSCVRAGGQRVWNGARPRNIIYSRASHKWNSTQISGGEQVKLNSICLENYCSLPLALFVFIRCARFSFSLFFKYYI